MVGFLWLLFWGLGFVFVLFCFHYDLELCVAVTDGSDNWVRAESLH